jgi:hypothetical protein
LNKNFLNHRLLFTGLFLLYANANAADSGSVYWVFFSDKGPANTRAWAEASKRISPRAKLRRLGSIDSTDLQVYGPYLDSLREYGLVIKNISRWLNGVTAYLPDSLMPVLREKPFIASLRKTGVFRRREPSVSEKQQPKTTSSKTIYGNLYQTLNQINVPYVHDFIARTKNEGPGKGIRIALFDSGFDTTHPCFQFANAAHAFIADSDFVMNDNNVGYQNNDPSTTVSHGTSTLSLIAGYDPGTFIGTAYAAEFILAKTEEIRDEHHTEEDNWAAALEWAEGLGADIINSSLGYRYDFDPPDSDYSTLEMDGKTAIASKAAAIGIAHGLIIVNSVGNEGNDFGDTSLNAPADVDGVIAVGAVNHDGVIAPFSSRGPSADGRIKPDVVAPGVSVATANYLGGYAYNSGSSFSAPLAAGCCALLKQIDTNLTTGQIREKLTATASRANTPNNTYGYGIINAMAPVLDSFSIYGGVFKQYIINPQESLVVLLNDGEAVCTTGPSGSFYFTGLTAGSYTVSVDEPGWDPVETTWTIPAHTDKRCDLFTISVLDTNTVTATVFSPDSAPLDSVLVTYSGPVSGTAVSNFAGIIRIRDLPNGTYYFIIMRTGYKRTCETVSVPIGGPLVWELSCQDFSGLLLYPVPCRSGQLTIEFIADSLRQKDSARKLQVALYTIDGTLIKTLQSPLIEDGGIVKEVMNVSAIPSGMYYAFIRFGEMSLRRKLPIINR